jgi:hypothetical protein
MTGLLLWVVQNSKIHDEVWHPVLYVHWLHTVSLDIVALCTWWVAVAVQLGRDAQVAVMHSFARWLFLCNLTIIIIINLFWIPIYSWISEILAYWTYQIDYSYWNIVVCYCEPARHLWVLADSMSLHVSTHHDPTACAFYSTILTKCSQGVTRDAREHLETKS